MKRNTTESYLARSSLRLENTRSHKPGCPAAATAGRARAAVAPPHHPQIQAVDHLHHKASQMLLRQPLINRRRQKEPGLAVDWPEVAHGERSWRSGRNVP